MAVIVEPGFGTQVARMVAGHINILLDQEEGCCPQCCAPCAALVWFRDNPYADNALAVWLYSWDLGWEWCDSEGRVRWSMIEAKWTMTDCHLGEEE